jgi:hypothetical protein
MITSASFACTQLGIMEHSGFYLTLPSNASAQIYRNNQSSKYTTNFPKPIELSEAWEVGLSEITYPHSWYNIKAKDRDFYCKRFSEPAKLIKLKKGFYRTVDRIVSELNEHLTLNKMEIFLFYNPIHKRIQISGPANGGIKTSGNLSYMLGMGPNKWTYVNDKLFPFPADIHAGFYNIFVYTDIITYQRVGDSCVPLLRTVHIDGKDGDIVTVNYDKPHYVHVSKNYIENILVELKTDQNENIEFTYGKTIVKLHFRPTKTSLHI